MPLDATADLAPRTHLDLRAENNGHTPWCGPAAVALATGLSCAGASALLRQASPAHYPEGEEVVTAWWRDLLAAMQAGGVTLEAVPVGSGRRRGGRRLAGLCRRGLAPGWYLVRVTDHFLLLHLCPTGLALLHDNQHTAVLPQTSLFARRLVTHAVRLSGGFGLAAEPARYVAA